MQEALALGIRTIIDVVPNHVSDQHAWFQAALAAGPGSPERERFWFRDGVGPGRRRDAQPLGEPVRRRDLDPHHEPRRHPRPVVPAPVHPRAARPQLEPPRRAPRARGHPPVLVRPRRRRRAHRLGGAAHQGPRARRGAREPRTGRAPEPGPRRAARRLPRLARRRRQLPRHARAGRRDLASGCRPLRRLPAPRRAAHGLQFRLPGPPVVGAGAPREHRPDPHRARAGAGALDLGAQQPRRHASRDAVRPRRLVVRVPQQALRHLLRPRARHPPRAGRGPPDGGPPRIALHLPGRRARAARGRGHPARAAPGPDALPVAGRRPGPGWMPRAASLERHRSAVRVQQRARDRGALAPAARGLGARYTVEVEAHDPRSMLSLYRAALGIRKDSRGAGRRPARPGSTSAPDALAFQRGDDFLCITNFADQPLALPSGAALVLASEELTAAAGRASPRLHGVAAHTARSSWRPHHRKERHDDEVTPQGARCNRSARDDRRRSLAAPPEQAGAERPRSASPRSRREPTPQPTKRSRRRRPSSRSSTPTST